MFCMRIVLFLRHWLILIISVPHFIVKISEGRTKGAVIDIWYFETFYEQDICL